MTQIALQLYTLRDFLKTPADVAVTLRRVREMGYGAVQVSGLGPIDPVELARILKGEGLTCCVTHVGFDRMVKEPEKLIEEHRLWGCGLTAVGGFWQGNAEDDWKRFAADYSRAADTLASLGLRIGYHNHSHEWIRLPSGRMPIEVLRDECSRNVWFEIDTYWVQHGGGDPRAWIETFAGRIPVVHLKDMRVVRNEGGQIVPQMAEVGEGNLNWAGILESCRGSGVQWYTVEQDTCQRDPFESVAMSLRNLKAMGLQ